MFHILALVLGTFLSVMHCHRLEGTQSTPALGRAFTLGELYDAKRDRLLGITLWTDSLAANVIKRKQPYTEVKVTISDSFVDKAAAFEVEGELRASLLSGLVRVKGAGNV